MPFFRTLIPTLIFLTVFFCTFYALQQDPDNLIAGIVFLWCLVILSFTVVWLLTRDDKQQVHRIQLRERLLPRYTKSLYSLPKGQYVYVVQDVTVSGLCKIGKAANPRRRVVDNFGVILPFDLECIWILKCNHMARTESELHQHFADKRVRGEWFALDRHDIEIIKKWPAYEPYRPSRAFSADEALMPPIPRITIKPEYLARMNTPHSLSRHENGDSNG